MLLAQRVASLAPRVPLATTGSKDSGEVLLYRAAVNVRVCLYVWLCLCI